MKASTAVMTCFHSCCPAELFVSLNGTLAQGGTSFPLWESIKVCFLLLCCCYTSDSYWFVWVEIWRESVGICSAILKKIDDIMCLSQGNRGFWIQCWKTQTRNEEITERVHTFNIKVKFDDKCVFNGFCKVLNEEYQLLCHSSYMLSCRNW